jgi:Uma2 family endonuclease
MVFPMSVCVFLDNQIEVPLDIRSLDDFRRWAQSDAYPQRGRIDYLQGRIEVDMSPEDLFTHGTPKAEICGGLLPLTKASSPGFLFVDSTAITSDEANLSAEPDIVFVSKEAIVSGRIRLVPKASDPNRFVEVCGGPDLVVELVSDHSIGKDLNRLPPLYFQAGVRELWLVDARRDPLQFTIHRRGAAGFEPVVADREGFSESVVFDRRFSLARRRDELGLWVYDLKIAGGDR